MPKDVDYHRAAIQYNEELKQFAAALANRIEHAEVKRWALAVSKQHAVHAVNHRTALRKLGGKAPRIKKKWPKKRKPSSVDIQQDQAEFAKQQEIDELQAAFDFTAEPVVDILPEVTDEQNEEVINNG